MSCASSAAPDGLYEAQFAVLGMLFRAHELFFGGIDALATNNRHTWAVCARGLLETFGAAVFALEKPDRLPSLLASPGISTRTLRRAARRALTGLDGDLKQLDSIVHPGSRSLLLGFRPFDEADQIVWMAVPPARLPPAEAEALCSTLITAFELTHDRVADLIASEKTLVRGKLIGSIAWRGSGEARSPSGG